MWLLYEIAMVLALVLAGPYLFWRRGGHYLASLGHRLGRHGAGDSSHAVWLHAVSVGEVGVAATLARALPLDASLLVTTVTPTGQRRAEASLASRATVAYLPFDLSFAIGRFFRRFSPRALVLVEGDLWPLLLRWSKRRGLPVIVVNGRISDRGFARWRALHGFPALRGLVEGLFGFVDHFGVQSERDAARLQELGVSPRRLTVTGNLKFETAPPREDPTLARRLRELAGGRPILVAGSTMEGEEGQVLAAFETLGGGSRALLILAPRHPERCAGVERMLLRRGLLTRRRSQGTQGTERGGGSGDESAPAVFLLDTLGDLAGLYQLATAAFIGGTLVPKGGHNPLEAALFGVPIAVGPAMENFRAIADEFDRAGAWRRVHDSGGLAAAWDEWLREPESAQAVGRRGADLVAQNGGALRKTLDLLAPILGGSP